MTLAEALAALRSARPLLERYGIARAGVFGSVARGEATPTSDLDVLVEFAPGRAPGWEFYDLPEALGRLAGCKVDVATEASLHRAIREQVLREAVYA